LAIRERELSPADIEDRRRSGVSTSYEPKELKSSEQKRSLSVVINHISANEKLMQSPQETLQTDTDFRIKFYT